MQVFGDFLTTLSKALEEIDPKWEEYDGLIVAGSHTPTNPESIIQEIRNAREAKKPILLICYGHQLGAIEYARNVKGIYDATSEEWGEGTFVVAKRIDGLNVGLRDGETYWNNYEVIIDWTQPEHMISTQSHPEYQSSIDKPHPTLVKFLNICKQHGK